jgi:hypothetical protein
MAELVAASRKKQKCSLRTQNSLEQFGWNGVQEKPSRRSLYRPTWE